MEQPNHPNRPEVASQTWQKEHFHWQVQPHAEQRNATLAVLCPCSNMAVGIIEVASHQELAKLDDWVDEGVGLVGDLTNLTVCANMKNRMRWIGSHVSRLLGIGDLFRVAFIMSTQTRVERVTEVDMYSLPSDLLSPSFIFLANALRTSKAASTEFSLTSTMGMSRPLLFPWLMKPRTPVKFGLTFLMATITRFCNQAFFWSLLTGAWGC